MIEPAIRRVVTLVAGCLFVAAPGQQDLLAEFVLARSSAGVLRPASPSIPRTRRTSMPHARTPYRG